MTEATQDMHLWPTNNNIAKTMPPSTDITQAMNSNMWTSPLLPEEDHLALKSDLDSLIPPHQRLHSFSSATSTEETVFSEDDSDDSDSDDDDDHPEVNENTLEDNHDNEEQSIEEGSIDSIDEGQQHVEAPPFETLVRDDDPLRAMSFSVNEEMVEVVPTDMVESVLPLWIQDWKQQRKEWTQLQKAIKLKRSHTHNDINNPFHNNHLAHQTQDRHMSSPIDIRRNRSEPNNNYTDSDTQIGRRPKHKKKYGSHPSQPFPHSRTPNPIVIKSSQKIGKRHARYALTAGMMLGIRESVGGALGVEAEIQIDQWEEWEKAWEEEFLMDEGEALKDDTSETRDMNESIASERSSPKKVKSAMAECCTTLTQECQRVSKYKFPPHQFYLGSNTSKPLPHKYKFKVYAPLIFARIRSLFGVEKQPFLHSICGKFNFYEFASNARSGQFFFYSHDGRYMIKTLTYTESKFLREILPYYYRHLSRYPHTFLTRFYGMYRVCMPHLNNQRLHFIIMKSVFSTEKKIDRVWDLKGSKTGRKSDKGDSVAKDLDILEEGKRLKFAKPGAKQAFLEQLRMDATFLARLGIMDYSLLLGMHRCAENSADTTESVAKDENDVDVEEKQEPCRSNTPFRRGVLQRAATGGTTTTANDGFKALEDLDQNIASKSSLPQQSEGEMNDSCFVKNAQMDETTMASTSSSSNESSTSAAALPANVSVPNPITSRSDEGIEGGSQLADGTLSVNEIYYCGIIDILQYYNARKVGETVIKQAAGNSSQDISCVDPESYGRRFVKFISNLVDE